MAHFRSRLLPALAVSVLALLPLACGDGPPEATPADHAYVAVLCTAAANFSAELDTIIAGRTGKETNAELIERTTPAMEAWVAAVHTGAPPPDATAYHKELVAALDLALRRFRDERMPDALTQLPPIPLANDTRGRLNDAVDDNPDCTAAEFRF